MEISENEENKKPNPVNNPQPFTHYRRVVYIVYTICICVHISAGTDLKKKVYVHSLKRI